MGEAILSLNNRSPPHPRTPSPLQNRIHPAKDPKIPQGEVRWGRRQPAGPLLPVSLCSPCKGRGEAGTMAPSSLEKAITPQSWPWLEPSRFCLYLAVWISKNSLNSLTPNSPLSVLKQEFCHHNSFYLINNFKKHFPICDLKKGF